ncbi:hypothetical protein KKQ11_00340 [Pseudomonas sp. MG-2]|uniref:hypothetical protein n=1 Tax=Pseudomonas sp. MG-2 TaxID=405714 RepID=UPI001C00767D|nr:hypothetical protein [Pseudomonas sp. MG-2]MBT9234270.1 hypothetical protein [Pseudomonas sp. MG-2]
MAGEELDSEALRLEIEQLQKQRDQYFSLGFLPQKRPLLLAVVEVFAALGSVAALISILMHGVGWVSAAFIVAGAWVLYSERQRTSTTEFLRKEYRVADSRLEELKYELGKRNVNLAAAEADWLELLHGKKTPTQP